MDIGLHYSDRRLLESEWSQTETADHASLKTQGEWVSVCVCLCLCVCSPVCILQWWSRFSWSQTQIYPVLSDTSPLAENTNAEPKLKTMPLFLLKRNQSYHNDPIFNPSVPSGRHLSYLSEDNCVHRPYCCSNVRAVSEEPQQSTQTHIQSTVGLPPQGSPLQSDTTPSRIQTQIQHMNFNSLQGYWEIHLQS